ncbi:phage integrase N-terminal SAM-like domain-containing protein, partial [Escherichia coli]|nr:phage integrase N-terminal SAM-like domain-containing protein [Escherichia coli]
EVANADKPPKFYSPKTSSFLNSVREAIRVRHLARSTEQSYLYCVTDFIRFHGRKHPKDMGQRK